MKKVTIIVSIIIVLGLAALLFILGIDSESAIFNFASPSSAPIADNSQPQKESDDTVDIPDPLVNGDEQYVMEDPGIPQTPDDPGVSQKPKSNTTTDNSTDTHTLDEPESIDDDLLNDPHIPAAD